jgi:two-component system response regulator (stage 0 sporulation protein A)
MENNERCREAAIVAALHKIGVKANIKGYFYLRTAIALTIEKPEEMFAVTKTLYPAIAKLHGTTPSCAERAMRHAIATAWERGDLGTLSFYFGNTVKAGRGKPSNSEFISIVAEKIKIGLDT